MNSIDLSKFKPIGRKRHLIYRIIWAFVWTIFARPLPMRMGSAWKRLLLRIFGAKVHKTARVYSSAKILDPSNLEIGESSTIASGANIYNIAKVSIGSNVIISQNATICTGSHDISSRTYAPIATPICIENQSWIAAEAFISMGVTIGEGAVVAARAVVMKNVKPWTIVVGNPAHFLCKREITEL